MSAPSLATQDLHELVDAYTALHPDDVLVVTEPVSPVEDITAVVWELAAMGRHPLLRFTSVQGLGVEVVTNMFASRPRVARLLGADPDGLHAAYEERAARRLPPRLVGDGPVLADVAKGDEVDLASLPLLTHFATDRAPYISSGVVVVEGEDGAGGNLSYHRAMVHSATGLATSLHSRGHLWRRVEEAEGRPLPVAMVIGGHPLFMLAASARVPAGVDERDVAGGLMGEPLEVVETPRHRIRVPATADFVLEGVLEPGTEVEEGPFGEFTGYSSDRSTRSLLTVETVLRRRDPMLADVVGGNSAEHLNLSRIPREAEMSRQLRERFPSVTGLHYPNSGTHFHAYVAVRQRRPGEARQVLLALLGWDPYLKTAIAVDDDVDLADDAEVLWAVATRFQPSQDLFVVAGLPGSALDPSSSSVGTTSRLGIDATRGPGFTAARHLLSAAARDTARAVVARLTGR